MDTTGIHFCLGALCEQSAGFLINIIGIVDEFYDLKQKNGMKPYPILSPLPNRYGVGRKVG